MSVRLKVWTRHRAQTVVTMGMSTSSLFYQELSSWDVGSGPEPQIVAECFCSGIVAWEPILQPSPVSFANLGFHSKLPWNVASFCPAEWKGEP